ncbi:hypothetical protein GGI19_000853 [Coemansia pectinata]|uniref:Uncharacterized protein n=1 Tax=Coemansia pectinata TaxID=1052879 RepID=A0A9W8LBT5_9FUNG|nr:hypothetical protein GGI19_000853 [Coemansia pectinata]
MELSSDIERCEEPDGAEARLAAYTTAAVAISPSVPDPPTKQGQLKRSTSPYLAGIEYYEGADGVKDGLCTPPWTWLEGVMVSETLVRGAFNTTLAVSAITLEAATKFGLTIYMGWQPRQIPAWMQVSCTVVGYIEAQVRVAGFRKMWVITEVVEQSQSWDLLLGNTLLNAIDIGLVMPIMPKRRKIKIEESRTSLAEGPYVVTKVDYGELLLPTVKEEPPVEITVGDMEIYGTYAIDFKIVAEMDRKPRATDKRLAEALPNTAMRIERTQAETEISSHESLAVEAGAAMSIFDATQSLDQADMYMYSETLHEDRYTSANEMSDSEYSPVEDMLITEIMPGTGLIVCRRVPLVSTKCQTPPRSAYEPSASPEY